MSSTQNFACKRKKSKIRSFEWFEGSNLNRVPTLLNLDILPVLDDHKLYDSKKREHYIPNLLKHANTVNCKLFLICVTLPKKFMRKEFNLVIRYHSYTTHPDHYLQRFVEKGILKHRGKGIYELA